MAQQSSGIPLIEIYWSLVDKADKKFSKIRDLPLYERNRSRFFARFFVRDCFYLGFVFDFVFFYTFVKLNNLAVYFSCIIMIELV